MEERMCLYLSVLETALKKIYSLSADMVIQMTLTSSVLKMNSKQKEFTKTEWT